VRKVLVCLPICGPTYHDVSVLDFTLCKAGRVLSHRYVDLAGFDHQAQLLRFACGTPPGIVGGRISWRRVDWDVLAGKMEDRMAANGRMEWDDMLGVVGGIGRARRTKRLQG